MHAKLSLKTGKGQQVSTIRMTSILAKEVEAIESELEEQQCFNRDETYCFAFAGFHISTHMSM